MDFPKKQAQRLMPLYLLEYSEKLFTNHPDPSAPWDGGGSDYTAGQGITITNNEISVDTNVIATKSDIPTKTSELTNDSGFITDSLGNTKTYSKYESSPLGGSWKRVTYDTNGILIETNDNTHMLGFPIDKEGEIAVTSDIPSLTGYATEIWVQNQGYATSSEIPTNYVTTDTEQTITGLKTIGQTSGTISEVDFNGFTFKLSNKAINNPEADIKVRNSSYYGYQYPTIYSTKGLYVNLAKIKLGDDGNNTYGITMPDSSTWEADRVLATTNDIPSLSGYATQTWVEDQGYATSSSLATVATTGSYNDLTDKPTIPDTTNFVTIDTNQTIRAIKAFGSGMLQVKSIGPTHRSLAFMSEKFRLVDYDEVKEFVLPTSKPSGTSDQPAEYTFAMVDDIPSTATSTSTSTVTPETGTFVTGTSTNITNVVNSVTYTPSSETLTFTYADNTTASFTFLTSSTTVTSGTTSVVTSVTDSTSNAMTGATVSTSTTTTLS